MNALDNLPGEMWEYVEKDNGYVVYSTRISKLNELKKQNRLPYHSTYNCYCIPRPARDDWKSMLPGEFKYHLHTRMMSYWSYKDNKVVCFIYKDAEPI